VTNQVAQRSVVEEVEEVEVEKVEVEVVEQ
jgi:hypothetical protein